MKYIKPYIIFESKELSEYFDIFIKSDIIDDDNYVNSLRQNNLWFREISLQDFMGSKYKNFRQKSDSVRRKEFKKYTVSSTPYSRARQKENCLCVQIGSSFNIDDVEIYIRRMLDYANENGYSYEVRKELQASRKSIDITNLINRRLKRKNNRVNTQKILSIQILFYKE
jgi:hypothetical protein